MRAVLLAALLLLPGPANACILYHAIYEDAEFGLPVYITFTAHPMIEGPIMVYVDEPGGFPAILLPTVENGIPALIDERGFTKHYWLDGKRIELKDVQEEAPLVLETAPESDESIRSRYTRRCIEGIRGE